MDLGNMSGLLQQMQDMQKKLGDMEKALESAEITGTAGGGEGGDEDSGCTITGNGKFLVNKLTIGARFARVLGESETALLCDLLMVAIHDYCKRAQNISGAGISGMASAMGLPASLLEADNMLSDKS